MKRRMAVALAAAVLLGALTAPAHALLSIGDKVNVGCISMRIVYTTCGIIPYPCAKISFWQPKWIVNTRASKATAGGEHRHFHHALVRPVNQFFAFNDPCTGCTVPTLAGLTPFFYKSAADPAWKLAQGPSPPLVLPIGLWGGAYPRVGFVTHPSPLVASGLAAVRAFNIARQPIDLWPASGLVRPTVPLVPSAQGVGPFPCMCVGVPPLPFPPQCFSAGFDGPKLMLMGPTMPSGAYEWIIWKRKRCTLPLPLNWCAEALNGLPKSNLCLLSN